MATRNLRRPKNNFSTNENIEIRSESPPGGRSPWTFSKRADIEDRKIGCDKPKVCWGEGQVHQTNHPGGTYLIEVKKSQKNILQ